MPKRSWIFSLALAETAVLPRLMFPVTNCANPPQRQSWHTFVAIDHRRSIAKMHDRSGNLMSTSVLDIM
jgi:hypothetical protein